MKAYINGCGVISAQHSFRSSVLPDEIVPSTGNRFKCIEPNYKEFIDPAASRRMGRIIKMGMASSDVCLKESEVELPDAIITGSALGCLEDTEKFLLAIIENKEQFLTPTSFIQSTHNTVGAQIALNLKCMNYNFTYVHKGFSFESAVLDAMMLLNEGNAKNVLTGGLDEMTDKYFRVCDRVNYWNKSPEAGSQNMKNASGKGSIAGEGSAFFMLSSEANEHSYAVLNDVKTIFHANHNSEISEAIHSMLASNNLSHHEIDLIICGYNGDSRFDPIYSDVCSEVFPTVSQAYFKHLCGEYQTASAFASCVASVTLKNQSIPDYLMYKGEAPSKFRNIVVLNSFMGSDVSAFLFSSLSE